MSSEQKPGEPKQSRFTVTDRRSFAGAGEPPQPAPEPPPAAEPPPAVAEPPAAGPPPGATAAADPTRSLPPVDFTTFVLSLGSSALMHLGEMEHPQSAGKPRLDLPLAKHTIDLLSMLQAKTKGNLTSQEDKLLESLLFDLRLRYVAAAKPSG
jgi:hypothetical protein